MIPTRMLKRQVWMADDDESEYKVKNSQRVLRLNDQCENHPYVEEFTKGCNATFVYRTYVLEGETDANFSLHDIWKLFQEDPLPNNTSKFCWQMINCMKAWNYPQKILDLPLNTEIIRQAYGLMMEDEKDVLTGEYRKSPAFSDYHIFAPVGYIERYMKDGDFRFHETKKDYLIMAATNLFGNIVNIHPFEDGNGRICRFILAHALIQMKCCLFPVFLNSFHRRSRRYYIKTVKMFDRKPAMLYTMNVRSLIHFWDNFEQNARTLGHGKATKAADIVKHLCSKKTLRS